jgi:5-methylcytosine-specific restriction endonuclease McrA
MPTRLCLEPRCPNPATYRGRCPQHARTHDKATNRAGRHVYSTKRWQLLRRTVLFEQPICAGCDNALAVDVDHVTPLAKGGAPYDRTNVQGLCPPCHSAKTRREQQQTA